ncbi:MAG: xanthine dehydrogenase family protein molybdopterin-binding subunit [Rhodospirillaceae bacterium]|nr:xanthine dehydrogenase family protein molybdopterin-binding subunit [Rhodospirillaceae bacterium]MBT5297654.1 xanthine dehydrogenase family protein molybdopterin-binding subunit [Rhodospirillaceae bacterium]MBT5513319.1 xanthine dehydrogenase family protein molybdopterin-binding subunit [Rhodospirillaceae bacterium]MBT6086763.1 xanthine dehydrogenase family protein molybdopterin-binding subunit [Rhodospirillaceae bacterium]MBT6884507.1 xanthine dehydrogenase family protein molybdopterin-bind
MMNIMRKYGLEPAMETSRRQFIVGAAAVTGGLVVGFGAGAATPGKQKEAPTIDPFDAYIQISADNKVTILSSQFDMGQGSYHGIATLVIEELGASWDQITVQGASGNKAYYANLAFGGTFQGSGGSTSITSFYTRYRTAGATARTMLSEAAAKAWGVPVTEISVAEGRLAHKSGKSATFGDMAGAAVNVPVPKNVTLKAPSEWTEIGRVDARRHDTASKTDGTHDFTIDVKLPGMLTAVMIHPPRFGGTVKSFDAAKAKSMPGVVDVVALPRGVAVVAQNTWAALQARDAVTVQWDDSEAEMRGTDQIIAEYKTLATGKPGIIAVDTGDADEAFAGAAKVLEAEYTFPYLAHAAMEPLNAVAHRNADGILDIWGGHQMPDIYQDHAAKAAGVKPEQVRMNIMKTGGGFGRRACPADGDITAEVASIAKAIGFTAPVKLQWTRENDMRGGRYRPAYVHRLKAGLDAVGNLVAWDHHIVGQSIIKDTLPFLLAKNGLDFMSVEGAANMPYTIPNFRVGVTNAEVGVPVLWWRSVGSTHNAYATEVFLDEVARAAGKDPLAMRLELLKDKPRHVGVLKLAAEKAGWGVKTIPKGHALGLSVHESFHSYVAEVAEVSVEEGLPKVHRVVAAVDCGIPINPNVIEAQVQGSIGFGLGAILAEKVTMTAGVVDQGNYDTYTPLRMNAMPDVDVHIVASDASPTGIGEPAVPPIGPAVANAVAAATGKVYRDLPMIKDG